MFDDITVAQPQFARCAIYGRYSTRMQRPATLEDQKRACREFAAEKGWQILDEHIYSDAALSGTSKAKRKALLSLEAAAEQKARPFDYVLVDDTSRVARDQADILTFVKLMRHLGIRVYFVSQKLDSGSPQFDMLLNLYSMFDAQYITRLSAKVWSAQKGRVLAGYIAGSWPYGYRSVVVQNTDDPNAIGRAITKGTMLKIADSEAEVIRRVFEMFVDGHSMWSICIAFNLEKLPSPKNSRSGSTDAAWSRDAIKRILRNPKYKGLMVWNATQQLEHPKTGRIRKEYKPAHEQVVVEAPDLRIVSDELWDRTQARLKELDEENNSRLLGGYNRAKNKPYLYSGLLFCAVCGSRMKIGGKGQNTVYECPNHRYRRGCHNALRIRQDRAAAQITEFLARQLAEPEYLDYLVHAVHDELKAIWKHQAEQSSGETLHELEQARRDCEKQIHNITDALANTGLQSLVMKLATLEFEMERIKDKINIVKGTVKKKITAEELLALVRENVGNLLGVLRADIPLARQVLQQHVKALHLYPSETEDGPVFEVVGEIDLFNGPNDPERGVLLGCSSTQTSQQHTDQACQNRTDRMYRFLFQLDPRLDFECPLLEPLVTLLESDPELSRKPRTPKQWAQCLSGVLPEASDSRRALKSGAVGWCLNNHRAILEQQLHVVETRNTYVSSPMYQLSLRDGPVDQG